MIIILDTCVFYRDLFWRGTPFRLLRNFLQSSTSRLCIPGVVGDEIAAKYGELYRERRKKLEAVDREYRKLFLEEPPELAADTLAQPADYYREFLGQLGGSFDCLEFGYPAVDHKQVVERALSRRKPFDKAGKIGYRDYLLWRSVLQIAGENPEDSVVFITENTGDFSDHTDKGRLSEHLQRDLEALGIGAGRITYYQSLDAFVDTVVKPLMKNYDKVANSGIIDLMQEYDSPFYRRLSQWTEEAVQDWYSSEIDLGIDALYDNLTIKALTGEIDEPNIEEVSIIDQGKWLISGDFGFVCEVRFDVAKRDVLRMKRIPFLIDMEHINRASDFVSAQTELWIRCRFDVVYDTEQEDILAVKFRNLRNGEDDAYMCGGCGWDNDDEDDALPLDEETAKALEPPDPNQISFF